MAYSKIFISESVFSFSICQEGSTRLDLFLAKKFPDYSRSFIKQLIKEGAVTRTKQHTHSISCATAQKPQAHVITKAGTLLKPGDHILLQIPGPKPQKKYDSYDQEKIGALGVKIVHQEDHFAIIEKPAGLTVHAPNKKAKGLFLVDWLIATFYNIATVGYADRPGIVHRLDKDTSGLMIIPLTAYAHTEFSKLFSERKIKKTYSALVMGHPEKTGSIQSPISHDSTQHTKMTCRSAGVTGTRTAQTDFEVQEYYHIYNNRSYNQADNQENLQHESHDSHIPMLALVKVKPVTGRTHQIRVHFASIGHPLVGDFLYNFSDQQIFKHKSQNLPVPDHISKLISRQALHAAELSFEFMGKAYLFTSPLPQDFSHALELIRQKFQIV